MPGIQLFGRDVSGLSFDSYQRFESWSTNPDDNNETRDGINTNDLGGRTLRELYSLLDLNGNGAVSNTELTLALGLIDSDGGNFSVTDVQSLSQDILALVSNRLMGQSLYQFLYNAGQESRASNSDYLTLNREQFRQALTTLMSAEWMNSQSAGGVRLHASDVADFLFELLQPPAQSQSDLMIFTARELTTVFNNILSRLVNKLDYLERDPATGMYRGVGGTLFESTNGEALESAQLGPREQPIYQAAIDAARAGLILAPVNAVSSRQSVSSATVSRFLEHSLRPTLQSLFEQILSQMEDCAEELRKAIEES